MKSGTCSAKTDNEAFPSRLAKRVTRGEALCSTLADTNIKATCVGNIAPLWRRTFQAGDPFMNR